MLLLTACSRRNSAPVPMPTTTPPGPATPTQETMHAILVRRCGECHQSSRSTAVSAALAVFDLDQADWPQRFDMLRFQVALERLGSEPLSDREAFIAFHRQP
jgi:hypothetical protein